FGLGTDRTMLSCQAEGLSVAPEFKIAVFLIALGEAAKSKVVELSAQLRAAGVSNDLAFGDRALKGAMKAADKSGAQFVIVIGDGELETSKVSIKRMSDGQQTESSLSELVGSVSRMSKEK
ncbi:MAG: hypothetical protein RIS43_953, partial [Actinomycetota bacterium]